jgi:hypothetical protein
MNLILALLLAASAVAYLVFGYADRLWLLFASRMADSVSSANACS